MPRVLSATTILHDALLWKGVKPTAFWRYRDEHKKVLFVTARYDYPDRSKEVIPWRPNGREGWEPGLPGFTNRRPLLALPGLLKAAPSDTVYIGEGEKVVAALLALGLCATTSSGGCSAAALSDWSTLEGFRRIIILPDNDPPGEKYAKEVVNQLAGLPGSRQVRIARLPGLPEGGDVVDWIQARCQGWDGLSSVPAECHDRLREELLDVIDECGTGPFVSNVSAVSEQAVSENSQDAEEWSEPSDLNSSLPAVEQFRLDFLPVVLQGWVADIAERLQAPIEFAAAAALTICGALIGRQLGIRPARYNDWTVIPNLLCCLIGPPSASKSPSLAQVRKPLDKLEAEAYADYADAMSEHKRQLAVHEARVKAAKKKLQEVVGDDEAFEGEVQLAARKIPEAPPPPACRRYRTTDVTTEKLVELLRDNPRGILILRDEIVGFLEAMNRPGREGDRAFFCEAWNATGAFTQDRIGRGTIRAETCCASVLGCATPGKMQSYVAEALADGDGADGFLQRFQLTLWPDVSETWQLVERWPDSAAREAAYEGIVKLTNIDSSHVGAECDNFGDGVPFLHFTHTAQALWDEWYSEHMNRVRRFKDEHPAFIAHLAKMQKAVAAIALICHMLDAGHGPVTMEALKKAIAWFELLESHARRLYGAGASETVTAARRLWVKIRQGCLSDGFTARDVRRKCWSGLTADEVIKGALKELVLLGCLRECVERTGGHPKAIYTVNQKAKGHDGQVD